MRFLLDTHVLLWWLDDPALLSKAARSTIQNGQNIVYVSAAAIWEIMIKKSLGKLKMPDALEQVLKVNRFSELPVTVPHTLALQTLPALKPKSDNKVPSCTEIGLEAKKKGDYRTARQMLRTACEQLEGAGESANPSLHLIELTTCIADSYLNEGRYDSAKVWYAKALDYLERKHGKNSLHAASLMVRLAEVSVLQPDMDEFKKYFEDTQRAYLLAQEPDTAALLAALIDLSWALCLQNHLAEAQSVNKLIAQIKQLAEEEKLAA